MAQKGSLIFFLPHVKGGVFSYVTNLCRHLGERGVRFRIVSYSNHFSFYDSLCTDYVCGVEINKVLFSNYSSSVSKYKLLSKFIDNDDIIVSNNSIELQVHEFYNLKNPVIYIFHGDLSHYYNTVLAFQNRIGQICCVSKSLMCKVKEKFPTIDISFSFPVIDIVNSSFINKFNSKISILFVGRFELAKGADVFIDLCNKFSTHLTNKIISWTVITEKKSADPYLLSIIPDFVHIKYDLINNDVLKIMGESDIFVSPSRTEGFGIAVLESMKMGMVPIVHDLPIGFVDIIDDDVDGFLIKIDDVTDFYNKISLLINDKVLLNTMKENAFLNSHLKFDNKIIVNNFLNIVSSVPFLTKNISSISSIIFFEKYLPDFIFRILKFFKYKFL